MFLGRNKVIFGTTWRWINYIIFGCAIPLRFLWFFRGVVRWSDCTGWRLWRSDVSHVLVQFFLGSGHLNHLNRRAHEAAPAWSHHCNPVGRKNKAAIKIHLYTKVKVLYVHLIWHASLQPLQKEMIQLDAHLADTSNRALNALPDNQNIGREC